MQKSTRHIALASAVVGLLGLSPAAFAHHAYNSSANGSTTWGGVSAATGYTDSTTGLDGLTRNSLSVGVPATPTSTSSYYQGTAPVTFLAAFHTTGIGDADTTAYPNGTPNPLGAAWATHELSTQDGVANKNAGAGFQLAASGSSAAGVDWGYIRSDFAATEIRITVTADPGTSFIQGATNSAVSPNTIQPWLALYSGWDNTYNGITGNATAANTSLAPLPGVTTVTGVRTGSFTDGANNPFGTTGLKYLGSVLNSSGKSSITYDLITNIAVNQHLTLLIGGAHGTAGNYLVSISENTAPVPEPEEYAMMLLGFGMVGYQIKRKQKQMAA
jgi:hypothetical protein